MGIDIVVMQQCESCRGYTHVGGYLQTGINSGNPDCDCDAYRYSRKPKTCKHIKEAEKNACFWYQQYSKTPIEKDGICPKCGGFTEYVKVGV